MLQAEGVAGALGWDVLQEGWRSRVSEQSRATGRSSVQRGAGVGAGRAVRTLSEGLSEREGQSLLSIHTALG